MKLKVKRIGVALTGSFCTYEKAFVQLRKLKEEGAKIVTVFIYNNFHVLFYLPQILLIDIDFGIM